MIICQDAIKCHYQCYNQRGTLTNFISLSTSLLKEPISSTTLLRFRPWEVVFVGFINVFLWKLICLCFYLARLNLFTFGYLMVQVLENRLLSFRMSWSGGSICCFWFYVKCTVTWFEVDCTVPPDEAVGGVNKSSMFIPTLLLQNRGLQVSKLIAAAPKR